MNKFTYATNTTELCQVGYSWCSHKVTIQMIDAGAPAIYLDKAGGFRIVKLTKI